MVARVKRFSLPQQQHFTIKARAKTAAQVFYISYMVTPGNNGVPS
jgi:hypothetical protein